MPKVVDHDAQRAELLAGAFDLFADRGYSATSVRALATGLGVSTGTLYHYFGGKDDIFEQMLAWLGQRDVMAAVSQLPPDADTQTRVELLFGWVLANTTYLRRLLLLALDYQRHRPDEAGQDVVRAVNKYYRDAFVEHSGAKNADAAWSLVLGMLVHGLMDPDAAGEMEHLAALTKLLS